MTTRAKEIRELGNTGYLEVDANGNVGIGTTSPTTSLTIKKYHSANYGEGTGLIDLKAAYPGYDEESVKAQIRAGTSDTHTLNTNGGYISFGVNQSGYTGTAGPSNVAEVLKIEKDGRMIATMDRGTTGILRQLTGGSINLFATLGKVVAQIGNNSSVSIASALGLQANNSANRGVYLISVNGGSNGNARDTGIYMVSISGSVDVYDSGMLVTEQFNNKGLRQLASGYSAADHVYITVTTLMRGYDSCYGNCGSFDMDQYGLISTGGAYGGCTVWAIHLIGDGKGGNTLWEG